MVTAAGTAASTTVRFRTTPNPGEYSTPPFQLLSCVSMALPRPNGTKLNSIPDTFGALVLKGFREVGATGCAQVVDWGGDSRACVPCRRVSRTLAGQQCDERLSTTYRGRIPVTCR